MDQSGMMRDKEEKKKSTRKRDGSRSLEVYKEEKRKKTRRKREKKNGERESSISDRIAALLSVAAKRVATFYIVWLHSRYAVMHRRFADICIHTMLSLSLFLSLRNAPRHVALEMTVFLPTIAQLCLFHRLRDRFILIWGDFTVRCRYFKNTLLYLDQLQGQSTDELVPV